MSTVRVRFLTSRLASTSLLALGLLEPARGADLDAAALREDFRIARAALEEGHSGIYRYTPKATLDREFDAAARRIARPMTALEFYRVLAPAVAKIKCGHTRVLPPVEIQQAIDSTIPLFPFDVEVLNNAVFLYRDYLPTERGVAGLEIRRINSVPMDRILATMLAAEPGDGDSPTSRPRQIGHGGAFASLLYSLLGIESPFSIELRDPATHKSVEIKVDGALSPERNAIAAKRYPQDYPPPEDLRYADDGATAILTLRTFANKIKGAPKPLGDLLADAFHDIHEHGSKSLIIDLRDNGGGSDELGLKLLAYLLDQPFRYYDDLIINKREFEFAPYTAGLKPIPEKFVEKRADGLYHNATHPNLGVHDPLQPHFGGRVFVLMNGGSFSTTCEFLSNLHNRKRATFLGEEAGGGYYGNTSGPTTVVTLPNSKVRVVIPLLSYYLAVKDFPNSARSIPPDYPIEPSIHDMLSGADPVMQKALELGRQPAASR